MVSTRSKNYNKPSITIKKNNKKQKQKQTYKCPVPIKWELQNLPKTMSKFIYRTININDMDDFNKITKDYKNIFYILLSDKSYFAYGTTTDMKKEFTEDWLALVAYYEEWHGTAQLHRSLGVYSTNDYIIQEMFERIKITNGIFLAIYDWCVDKFLLDVLRNLSCSCHPNKT